MLSAPLRIGLPGSPASMCVRPPAPRSSRVDRASLKAASAAAASHRTRSMSTVSTASSTWSPTSMVAAADSVSGRWVEDSVARACAKCEKPFTLTNRRHHCRVCGDIFCHACSRTRMVLATSPGEIPRRQRVCDPCATHAHSSAILYDAEEAALGPRDPSLYLTRLSETELVPGASISDDMLRASSDTHHSSSSQAGVVGGGLGHAGESSTAMMLASTAAFALAFWFLKAEVSASNPAVWILLVGFVKNLHELSTRLSGVSATAHKSAGSRVMAAPDADQVFKDMDDSAAEASSTTSSSVPGTPAKDPRYASIKLTPAVQDDLIASSSKAMDKVYELAMAPTEGKEWTPEVPSIEGLGIKIFSCDGKPSRFFKCEAEIPLSPDELFDEIHGKFETSSTWNVTSAENNVVTKLNETTDVVHVVSAPALGGMITSRDFVNVRTWRKQDGGYLIGSGTAGKSVVKAQKGIVRGENGPTGYLILPHESSPFKSRLVWILNVDIKGYFPSSVVRKGSISEVSCYIRNLRRYLANSGSHAPMEGKTSDVQ